MSIYATHWILKFPRYGDAHTGCEWVEVVGQGVPAHVGAPTPGQGYEDGDPYANFLPPAVVVRDDYDGIALRAMVIVRAETEKLGQEYVHPLLVLSGKEYAALSFVDLHDRICDSLRGSRPRCVGEWHSGDGRSTLIFEDGSSRDLPME